MAKRKQRCDHCGLPIRHGFPLPNGKLICNMECKPSHSRPAFDRRGHSRKIDKEIIDA